MEEPSKHVKSSENDNDNNNNEDEDTIMTDISNNNANKTSTTFMGTFRRKALVDHIEVSYSKGINYIKNKNNVCIYTLPYLYYYYYLTLLEIRKIELKESQFEQDWKILNTLVKAILNANTIKTSFQVAYELCQSLCLYGYSKKLYNYLNETLSIHVQQEADILLA